MPSDLYQPNETEDDLLGKISSLEQHLRYKEELLSFHGRNIIEDREIHLDSQIKSDYIVLTTYFSTKSNPQNPNTFVPKDDIEYINSWYQSVKKLGLTGIVFYDNLSKDFISMYETDRIHFVHCSLGQFSLNDERFLIYYIYLLNNHHYKVFMTDGNDVYINTSPFSIINLEAPKLFVGRDNVNKIRQSEWMCEAATKFEQDTKLKISKRYLDQPIYNAGILGGNYLSVIFTLFQMVNLFVKADSAENHNMTVLNYVINNYWLPKTNNILYRFFTKIAARNIYVNPKRDILSKSQHIESGFPLNSAFRKFEKFSNAYFIHK